MDRPYIPCSECGLPTSNHVRRGKAFCCGCYQCEEEDECWPMKVGDWLARQLVTLADADSAVPTFTGRVTK